MILAYEYCTVPSFSLQSVCSIRPQLFSVFFLQGLGEQKRTKYKIPYHHLVFNQSVQSDLNFSPCSCPSCSCPSSSRLQYVTPYGNYSTRTVLVLLSRLQYVTPYGNYSTRTRTTRTRIVLFRNSPQYEYGTRANTVQVPYSYEYSYAASRHDVRTSTGKLFAICNALPFDNLGQMSDKTKQFCQR